MRALFMFFLFFSARAGAADLETFVKIRVEKDLKELAVNGSGLRVGSLDGEDPLRWSRRVIKADGKGWSITEPGTGRAWRQPPGPLFVRGTELRTARQELPARLMLIPRKSKFDVVANLDLRQYLTGVVAHEMPPSWPAATLRAQAVAARSYALAVRRSRALQPWHLESTIDDQVFRVGDPVLTARAREAVTGTDGLVLKKSDRVLKAYYHADCGGRTVAAPQVWAGEPDTGTAVDEFCPSSPSARWRFEIPLAEAARKLGALMDVAPGLELDPRGERVAGLRVGGKRWDGNQFRLALGSQRLKSTRFQMTSQNGMLVFNGRGFGHGVGLCQWGSRAMGLRGFAAEAILSHYYPKATLARVTAP